MFHRWAALALVLALCAVMPGSAAGQASNTPPRGRKLGTLGQNYPNPFTPETFIPFTIDDCNGPGGQHVVSLRVYNVLAQLVATPVLHGAGKPIAGMILDLRNAAGGTLQSAVSLADALLDNGAIATEQSRRTAAPVPVGAVFSIGRCLGERETEEGGPAGRPSLGSGAHYFVRPYFLKVVSQSFANPLAASSAVPLPPTMNACQRLLAAVSSSAYSGTAQKSFTMNIDW